MLQLEGVEEGWLCGAGLIDPTKMGDERGGDQDGGGEMAVENSEGQDGDSE